MPGLGIRGSNPIWSEVNLWGKLFDDTYYMWVLQNQIPYIPANIFNDPDLSTPLNNPIQFLGNGTLPVDVFFESNVVYRLEFRQHLDPFTMPTQSDPLIYEVDNYVPGEGGSTPINTVSLSSDNQISNPQFALVNFNQTLVLTALTNPAPIQIGPDWVLEAAGTGNVTITQVPLSDTVQTTSNAPYALEINVSGWTEGTVFLRQRFYQNGMLWSSSANETKFVSSTLTAKVNGTSISVNAFLEDSNSTFLTQVLNVPVVDQSFNEFTGVGEMPIPANPDVPPTAYIDYKLALPSNCNIFVASIQLIVQDIEVEPEFVQDSINRQIDHTFHDYKDPLSFKPIESILVGWDFAANPAQLGAAQSVTNTPAYAWDQTVMQSRSATTTVARQANTRALQFTTATANESVLMLQYLSGEEAVRTTLSNLAVNLQMYSLNNGGVKVTVGLYYSNAAGTIPSLLTSPATIGTLGAAGVFTLTQSGWTQIAQNLGFSSVGTVSTTPNQDIQLSGFNGRANFNSSATTNFAIAVTFSVPTSGTIISVQSISLVLGDIATRPAPKTFDETLRECQFYYEKSWAPNVAIGLNTYNDAVVLSQGVSPSIQLASGAVMTLTNFFNQEGFDVIYKTTKRAVAIFTFYSTQTLNTKNVVSAYLAWYIGSPPSTPTINSSRTDATVATFWTQSGTGQEGVNYHIINNALNTTILSAPAQTVGASSFNYGSAEISFHYTADARLGYV